MRPTRTRSDRACFGIPFPVYRPAHDPEAPLRGAGRYRRTRCGDVTADARRGSVTSGAKLTALRRGATLWESRPPARPRLARRRAEPAIPPPPRNAQGRPGSECLPPARTSCHSHRPDDPSVAPSEQHPTRLLRRKIEGALPIRTGVNEPTAFLHSPAPANRPSPVTGTGRRPRRDAVPPRSVCPHEPAKELRVAGLVPALLQSVLDLPTRNGLVELTTKQCGSVAAGPHGRPHPQCTVFACRCNPRCMSSSSVMLCTSDAVLSFFGRRKRCAPPNLSLGPRRKCSVCSIRQSPIKLPRDRNSRIKIGPVAPAVASVVSSKSDSSACRGGKRSHLPCQYGLYLLSAALG